MQGLKNFRHILKKLIESLRFKGAVRDSGRACARTGWVGQAQRATTNTDEATKRTRSKHRAGIVSEAGGQCEVFAKCERTLKLPQNVETGAPRADASDGEKAGVKLAKMLNYTY